MNRTIPLCLVAALAAFLLIVPGLSTAKMEPEEVIQQHLSAVGPLKEETARVGGQVDLQILSGGRASMRGPFQILSRPDKFLYEMRFNAAEYVGDRFVGGSDGVEVDFSKPGERLPLAEFMHVYPAVLREGLWGGVLNASYPFYKSEYGAKLKYAGLKKEEGRKLHRIDYRPDKPYGGLRYQLYFEPDTMRHVLTVYELTQAAPLGEDEFSSARQRNTRHRLEEHFADFKDESGRMLPHLWTVRYYYESTNLTLAWEWKHQLNLFQTGLELDDSLFKVEK
ncbi:MAG TPA: hypothetical protein VLV83_27410 [Acidobacteriota bacterium]|nr:hypothetical protein [Acidobacteriota bacterium]